MALKRIALDKSCETTVIAQDGETVVLGGVITRRNEKDENKVPWLGDLPGIGALFRYRTENKTKTELLIIMTPRVLRTREDAELFKQVEKCIRLLLDNPRHPGLNMHEYRSIPHPYDGKDKVFAAYVQNKTPGAYRLFWCYGPSQGEITLIALTPHP